MSNSCLPRILSINISKGGIPKLPVESAQILTSGLEGDGHNHDKHYRLIQAVCLQDVERLSDLNTEGYDLFAGSTGENLTVKNLNVNGLPLGTILGFKSGVEIELAKVRKPCYVLDEIDEKLKEDIVGRCGMYAQVNKEGVINEGDVITVKLPDSVG
ncbi:MAG: MOSC domain-containing protein YiiM [Candidatus Omnitrophota bacterium]|jgi:MOSC domain-containing protein YiiM